MALTAHAKMRQTRTCLHMSTSDLRPRPLPRSLARASQRSDGRPCRPCRGTRSTVRAEKHERSSHQGRQSSTGRQLLGLTAAGVITFAAGTAGTADQCSSRANVFIAHIGTPVEIFATVFSGSAWATSKVGEFAASGFIFKDSVEAVSVEDPDGTVVKPNLQLDCITYALHRMLILQYCFLAVKGVTIYISDFHRSLSDKLNKDFFNEPSQVRCSMLSTPGLPNTHAASAYVKVTACKNDFGKISNSYLCRLL